MHTLTLAERKTFQCINDTKKHLPYCNPDLKAVKTVQLLYINRAQTLTNKAKFIDRTQQIT